MKKFVLLILILAVPFVAADPVIPQPSCSAPLSGTFGANLGSQAFELPESKEANYTELIFNTADTGTENASSTLYVILSASERSSVSEGTPSFDANWIRWVNISFYVIRGAPGNDQRTLTIQWQDETVTHNANSQYGILSTTWGGTNLLPGTAGYRYLSVAKSVSIASDILRDRTCNEYDGYLRLSSGSNFTTEILPATFLDVKPVDLPPGAAQNFTVSPGAFVNVLEWDPPIAGDTPTGYKIYRRDPTILVPTLLATIGTNTSYNDAKLPCTQAWQYAIVAFNGEGDGPSTSWSASTTPRCRNGNLFGDDGQIYGPGGKEGLGEAFGVSSDSAGILWGILVTLLLTCLGAAILASHGMMGIGAGLGGIVGGGIAFATGMFPLWLLVLVIVLCGAIGILLSLFLRPSEG